MSILLTIYVKNLEPQTQNFYFFQQLATYTGGGQAYSNSLFSQSLGNYDATGATLTFQVHLQCYAGIQQTNTPPVIGSPSGYASASRAIDLAPSGSGSPNDWTTATFSPLGLSTPINSSDVEPGAFRISTPGFTTPPYYNVGSTVEVNGGLVLSNFVQANPLSNTDCQPILKYYVQTGSYTEGTVIDFTQSAVNAALADFSTGYTTCMVTLNANGTWHTELE
ncbi:hypothetical protein FP026_10455 [Rhizobium tropici]|uniref:Uncharacterized protein n=1 Tax=Rhizobium tropici TaxID=398 RepID=A0A5B0W6A7_RHITR|nr:hypothetical protein [Rhizobium tropici]KAA1182486.1 hypothetical protein FP026_10455 [Rhizobium tropici]